MVTKAIHPLVQMASLHRHHPPDSRDGVAIGEKENGPCSSGQTGGKGGPPEHGFEFLTLGCRQENSASFGGRRHESSLIEEASGS